MVGIEDVASLAGVSISTVSRAMNRRARVSEATVKKVQDAARSLGYVPSSSAYTLATGKHRNIGVVVPRVDQWVFGAILSGVTSAVNDAGSDLTLYQVNDVDHQRAAVFSDFILRRRVDALLIVSVKLTADEFQALASLEKPVLAIGGFVKGAHTLSIDDFGAGELATRHLLSLGHHEIGFVGGTEETEMEFHPARERRRGHESALGAAGIEAPAGWFESADFTVPGGYAAAKRLLSDPRNNLTAIAAASDEMAFGVMQAARDLGFTVPGDISVVGIDDHDLAGFYGLTTVAQDARAQGAAAAAMLLEQLQRSSESDAPVEQAWPIRLIARSSTSRIGSSRLVAAADRAGSAPAGGSGSESRS